MKTYQVLLLFSIILLSHAQLTQTFVGTSGAAYQAIYLDATPQVGIRSGQVSYLFNSTSILSDGIFQDTSSTTALPTSCAGAFTIAGQPASGCNSGSFYTSRYQTLGDGSVLFIVSTDHVHANQAVETQHIFSVGSDLTVTKLSTLNVRSLVSISYMEAGFLTAGSEYLVIGPQFNRVGAVDILVVPGAPSAPDYNAINTRVHRYAGIGNRNRISEVLLDGDYLLVFLNHGIYKYDVTETETAYLVVSLAQIDYTWQCSDDYIICAASSRSGDDTIVFQRNPADNSFTVLSTINVPFSGLGQNTYLTRAGNRLITTSNPSSGTYNGIRIYERVDNFTSVSQSLDFSNRATSGSLTGLDRYGASFRVYSTFITDGGPICGNGVVETGEQCDDGNTVDDDSCTNACTSTYFGPCTGGCDGYCLFDAPLACSCKSGFSGANCSVAFTLGTCLPELIVPSTLNYAVSLDATLVSGDLSISFEIPVQSNIDSGDDSYSTFTVMKINDNIVYPTTDHTVAFSLQESQCTETITVSDPFSDFSSNFDLECSDIVGDPVDCFDPTSCSSPPCRKIFSAIVQTERGYVMNNGRKTSDKLSSSQHILDISYPWVESAGSVEIEVVTIPEVENNFVVESLVFDSEAGEWEVIISTSVLYPWRLGDDGSNLFEMVDSVSSVGYPTVLENDDCPLNADECTQIITVTIDGCEALTDEIVIQSSNLLYTCNADECPSTDLAASFTATIAGTKSGCSLEVDVGTVDPTMSTHDDDYSTVRNSFVAGSVDQAVHFRVEVAYTAGTGSDTISAVTLVNVFSDKATGDGLIDTADITVETTLDPCDDADVTCFSILANTLVNGELEDDSSFETTTVTAYIQIDFANTGETKRMAIKRSIGESAQSTFRIDISQEETSSALSLLTSSILLIFILAL